MADQEMLGRLAGSLVDGMADAGWTIIRTDDLNRLRGAVIDAEQFIDKIREYAYIGGQNGEIVRTWILQEFERTGRREKKS